MYTALQVSLNLFSLAILLMILVDLKYQDELHSPNQFNYIELLHALMIVLVLEAVGWIVDKRPGIAFRTANICTNTAYFIMDAFPAFFWAIYVTYNIFGRTRTYNRLRLLLLCPALINVGLCIANLFNGWMFTVSADNVYERGERFYLLVLILVFYIAYANLMVIMNKKRLSVRAYHTLLLFSIPPIIGGALQFLFYGMPSIWTGATLMLLMIYLNIQRIKLGADPLTGISNRRDISSYIKDRIRESATGVSFSGIFIDINNFKSINDTHGHVMGDRALQLTADLLRKSTRKDDFIARYGGDEFLIILPKLEDRVALDKMVSRIKNEFEGWNKLSILPFDLSLSIGSSIYEKGSELTAEQFIRHLDTLMYKSRQMS